MTTSFQILSSSVLTTSVIRLLRVRISDSLVKETADNWFRCVALQAVVSYNMLVKLAHFFPPESNRCSCTYSVCYFRVTVCDSAVLRSKCQGNVGEFPCVGTLFCALKIDLCFMSNSGSLVSCLPDSGGHSLSLVLAKPGSGFIMMHYFNQGCVMRCLPSFFSLCLMLLMTHQIFFVISIYAMPVFKYLCDIVS